MNTEFSVIHFDTGSDWRGGQNQVFLLIKELKQYNISQLLVSPSGSPLYEKCRNSGIDVFSVRARCDMDVKAGLEFRKAVQSFSAGIVHYHTSRALGVGSWALKGLKTGKVCTRRVDLPVSGAIVNRIKYKSADVIVAISQFIRDYMKETGYENTEMVYSSVDIAKYEHNRCYENKPDINVAMAGAFDLRHKDFETFIKSAVLLAKNRKLKNIKFFIAGSGPDRVKIEKIIRRENIESKVEVKGFVEDMSRFLKETDILVHNVNFEGLGTVILQGMASGLPVVAADIGGISEIIEDEENGFMVPVKGFRETAEKIALLAGSAELREKLGRAGQETVRGKFSPDKMARRYMDIYREVLKK